MNRPHRTLTCAIHQPNLFPRLSTLAKLHAADIWIVLDDVQFNQRDYQHRARLAAIDDPTRHQWLTLPTHRPSGRNSRINEVLLLEPAKSARRVTQLVQQHYGRAPHWAQLDDLVHTVAATVATGTHLADITQLSTQLMLKHLGWRGSLIRSSDLAARQHRSARLADLALAVGADEYLCGTGGARYIDEAPFTEYDIHVRYVSLPPAGSWQQGRKISALHWLATIGNELGRTLKANSELAHPAVAAP
jgi:hypothetical protein